MHSLHRAVLFDDRADADACMNRRTSSRDQPYINNYTWGYIWGFFKLPNAWSTPNEPNASELEQDTPGSAGEP